MTTKEIKKEAKARLSGNWKIAILNLFLVTILTSIISEVLLGIVGAGNINNLMSAFSQDSTMYSADMLAASTGETILSTLATIVVSFITAVFVVGYDWSLLDMVDGEKLTVEAMFQAMKPDRFFKVLGISVVMNIFVILWSLLLVIPGIIKSFSYSQSFNVYKDDSDMDIMGAIHRSKEIMDGRKWDYFKLQFSFVLWYLIPVILFLAFILGSINTIFYQIEYASVYSQSEFWSFVFGMILVFLAFVLVITIISFYVEPYRKTANQIFYRDLVGFPDMEMDEVDYEENSSYSTEYIDPYDESDDFYDSENNNDRF
ncbi:DUF975 family protein [Desemzia sp. RIT804]|uniref:DUF975 family protein n=1 Tax=Desemzia sp. RIT 804 TaxID=2810209 RepID=UPI00195113BE|nr:DUF975 family protein [Desemzia sp. RIT 804]MBM6613958.1 DUF975 family protein [Desemzia sp. RIT 804]